MGKAEIFAELPRLNAEDRSQVLQRLYELQDRDLLQGIEPSPKEKLILDEALAEFQRDGNLGIPWRESLRRIRSTRPA